MLLIKIKAKAGIKIKINQFDWYALSKSRCSKWTKAFVNPHPGHGVPKIDFQMQGMQMSIPVVALSMTEKNK